ncbi:hypothetical protein [Megamonas funiformis]|uniref:hypothetical protein n=1 Tax=Megamonas funiformis TaxID=437897 RepID=UPI00265C9688|nr:hypothetical protein [Megamonas funiformis]
MKGYTTISQDNAYRSLPDDLDDIGNSMGSIKFYSFGQNIKPLEGREHRKFADGANYDETITAIYNVVENADTNHLSIIITDLFESDSDWSNVTKQLKEKYFSQHLSVAIIGIKNPFKGEIFDVGLNAAKFDYDSGNDPAKYRPFYMFILGQDSEVKKFIQLWKNRYAKTNEVQYLVFSENLMDKVADLSNMEIKDSNNIFSDEQLSLPNQTLKEYDIDSLDENSSLTASFNYSSATDGCNLDMNKLSPDIKVWVLKDGQWQESEQSGDIKCTFRSDESQEGNYLVSVNFTGEKTLTPNSINLIHIAIKPEDTGFILPDWIRAWNMDSSAVNMGQFDGSKTVNFLHIAESLKDSVLSTAQPSLVNMNLVIQTK